jgi:6-phosphogluconolactonase
LDSCAVFRLAIALVISLASAAAHAQQFIYVSNFGDSTISGFSMNSSTGALTPVAGSPFAASVGPGPLAHDGRGEFLYAALQEQYSGEPCSTNFAELNGYSVAAKTGTISIVDDVTLPDYCPSAVVVDPTGKFVYVALIDFSSQKVGAIAAYEVSDGSLTAVSGSPFLSPVEVSAGQQPAIGALAISHNGATLYASDPNDSAGILIFNRNTKTGALTFSATFNSNSPLGPMTIDRAGNQLLASPPLGDGVYVFDIGSNGNLTPESGSPFASPAASAVNSISISQNGDFIALAQTGGVSVLQKKASGLTLITGSPFGSGAPAAATFDSSSHFVYVPGTVYSINQKTGVLTRVSTFQTGNTPYDIVADKPVASQ